MQRKGSEFMYATGKTIKWAMVLIIISAIGVTLFSQPPLSEHTDRDTDLIYLHPASDPLGGRANDTPLDITYIPQKATGDFIIEVGIPISSGINISDVVLLSSTDKIIWKEQPVEKYRSAANNTMVVQGSQLDEGVVYLGVSRPGVSWPDDYGTVEITTPKDITVSEASDIFEPSIIVYIIIIVAIVIFGLGALLYKAGTDQIKGMMRQIHKEERMKEDKGVSGSGGYDHDETFVGSHRRDSKDRGEISWGGSNDDDTTEWGEEPERNDVSWGDAGDERPRNRRRGRRDEIRERSNENEISWGGAGDERPRRRGGRERKGEDRGRPQREPEEEPEEDEISWGSNYRPRKRGRERYDEDVDRWEEENARDRYGTRGERSGRERERRGREERRSGRGKEAARERRGSERKERRDDQFRKTGSGRTRERDRQRDRGGRTGRKGRKTRSAYGKRRRGNRDDYRHASRRYERNDDDLSWSD